MRLHALKCAIAALSATMVFVACGQSVAARNAVAPAEPRWSPPHYVEPTPTPTAAPTLMPQTPAPLPVPAAAPRPVIPPAPQLPAAGNYSATGMQILVNQDRAAAGLPPLAWSPCLGANAQAFANRIAAAGALNEPQSDLQANLACGFRTAGENQGWYSAGVNDSVINDAYMNSPDHKANILNPNYRYIGTAWATASNGYAYNAEEFGG